MHSGVASQSVQGGCSKCLRFSVKVSGVVGQSVWGVLVKVSSVAPGVRR